MNVYSILHLLARVYIKVLHHECHAHLLHAANVRVRAVNALLDRQHTTWLILHYWQEYTLNIIHGICFENRHVNL